MLNYILTYFSYFSNSQNKQILKNNQTLVIKEAAESYRKNKNAPFQRIKISDVTQREANDIKNLLGIDVSGYTHNINKNAFEHIENRHRINGEHDSTMADSSDVARIGYVIQNYDTVERLFNKKGEQVYSGEYMGGMNKPAPMIRYSKKIDGTMYVVEAAAENSWNKIWVVSAYTNRKDGFTQVHHAYKDLQATSETPLASHPSSDTNISQDDDNVNSMKKRFDGARDKEKWTAKNLNNSEKRIKEKSLSEIIKKAEKAFNIPISSGRMGNKSKDSLGFYKVHPEAVRTKTTNDLPTICHEIGHHLDKKYNLQNISYIDEAVQNMDSDFAALYSRNEIKGEAVAEFVREYLKDKTAAKNMYPNQLQ